MKPTSRPWLLMLVLALTAVLSTGCDRKADDHANSTAGNSPDISTPNGAASGLSLPPVFPASDAGLGSKDHASGPLNTEEQSFAKTAAESGLYEVAVAKLATEKAQNADVKAMAKTLVDDHSKANGQLTQAIGSRMTLPTSIPVDKQKTIDTLNKLSGADFDRQFVKMVGLQDHQTDISLFEGAQNFVKDPALRDFVQGSLPTLRQHHSMAQGLAKAVGADL
ncbi:MAG: DUF4142 domain-containing protein [Acidobacteriota bacterium]